MNPPDMKHLWWCSVQLLNGDQVTYRGLAGVPAGRWDPSRTTGPRLPCVWIIQKLVPADTALARAMDVAPGNVYIQLRYCDDATTFGRLPAGKRLWKIRELPPGARYVELLSQYYDSVTWGAGCVPLPDSAEALVAELANCDNIVSVAALEKIKASRDPKLVPALVRALDDTTYIVRCRVVMSLGAHPDTAVVPVLVELLDTDRRTSGTVANVLAQIGDRRAVGALIRLLQDQQADGSDRGPAALALGAIKDQRAVEPLIAALADSDTNVRHYATTALGSLGDTRAVDPLLRLLEREADPIVVYSVVSALGELGDARALKPLEQRLRRAGNGDDVTFALEQAIEELRRTRRAKKTPE